MNLRRGKQEYFLLVASFATLYLLFGSLPVDQEHNHNLTARLMDAGHYPLFLFLGLLMTRIRGWSRARTFFIIGGFAAIVELLQPLFDRSESIDDLFYGLLGLGSAVIFDLLKQKKAETSTWLLFNFSTLALFVLCLIPSQREWKAVSWRQSKFPLLSDFESLEQMLLWQNPRKDIKLERRPRSENSADHLLLVQSLTTETGSAIYLAGDLDWSRFSYFSFEIYLPPPSLEQAVSGPTLVATGNFKFHLRIDDSEDCQDFDSRFNSLLELHAGWNRVDIPIAKIQSGPKARQLDMQKIRKVYFFGDDATTRNFSLDNLHLSE